MNPGPPPPRRAARRLNPVCPRLEAQLATIDRGGGSGDPAKEEQIRRYQEAASKQQGELDRVTSQAKRMGCDSSGFFSLFSGQSAQCGPVNNQIQQMRGNLDQITTSLERLRGGGFGGAERENQRRSVLTALAQNNCGPQYANAARGGGGNFLDNLFGDSGNPSAPPAAISARNPAPTAPSACAPATAPISRSRSPRSRRGFRDDEKTCKALCPATEATLFAYRNPGEDINQAVSITGQPYSALPNAFKYRTEFNPSCGCKAAGQTWSDALKTIDDKAARRTAGRHHRHRREREEDGAAAGAEGAGLGQERRGNRHRTCGCPRPKHRPPPADATAAAKDKPIRSVGPTFIPTNPPPR